MSCLIHFMCWWTWKTLSIFHLFHSLPLSLSLSLSFSLVPCFYGYDIDRIWWKEKMVSEGAAHSRDGSFWKRKFDTDFTNRNFNYEFIKWRNEFLEFSYRSSPHFRSLTITAHDSQQYNSDEATMYFTITTLRFIPSSLHLPPWPFHKYHKPSIIFLSYFTSTSTLLRCQSRTRVLKPSHLLKSFSIQSHS